MQDPLSLVPWMQTLFTLADAGMTTFDVSGRFFPFTNIRAVFSSDNNASYYEGTESVLGMFKRRWGHTLPAGSTRPTAAAHTPTNQLGSAVPAHCPLIGGKKQPLTAVRCLHHPLLQV